MQEKGAGYARWAAVYNLKQMAKTLVYLRDHQVDSAEQLRELAAQKAAKRDELLSSIQSSEQRFAEIAALKKHIINYSKTRSTYEAYRKLRDEAQALAIADRNIASLYETERQEQQKGKEEKTH